jgi:hypothetical protein
MDQCAKTADQNGEDLCGVQFYLFAVHERSMFSNVVRMGLGGMILKKKSREADSTGLQVVSYFFLENGTFLSRYTLFR